MTDFNPAQNAVVAKCRANRAYAAAHFRRVAAGGNLAEMEAALYCAAALAAPTSPTREVSNEPGLLFKSCLLSVVVAWVVLQGYMLTEPDGWKWFIVFGLAPALALWYSVWVTEKSDRRNSLGAGSSEQSADTSMGK